MMRPRFEKPVDTAQDMVDRNITLFEFWYYYPSRKDRLESLNIPEYSTIAENMILTDENQYHYTEYYHFVEKYIHEAGTHAIIMGYLDYYVLQVAPMHKWWKSSETVPLGMRHGGYITDRNWILNEEYALNILHFQQVCLEVLLVVIVMIFFRLV